jgi:predicted PurR-regulated permease PerM
VTIFGHPLQSWVDFKNTRPAHALMGLFVLAFFYTMYFIRAILLPFVLAMLLSCLLRRMCERLAM